MELHYQLLSSFSLNSAGAFTFPQTTDAAIPRAARLTGNLMADALALGAQMEKIVYKGPFYQNSFQLN